MMKCRKRCSPCDFHENHFQTLKPCYYLLRIVRAAISVVNNRAVAHIDIARDGWDLRCGKLEVIESFERVVSKQLWNWERYFSQGVQESQEVVVEPFASYCLLCDGRLETHSFTEIIHGIRT